MSDDADFDSASAASVLGNTTNKTKIAVSRWLHIVCRRRTGFGDDIGNKVRLTEISVKQTPNEPEKMEGKVVAEITVTQGTRTQRDLMEKYECSSKKFRYDKLEWGDPRRMHYVFGRHASRPVEIREYTHRRYLLRLSPLSVCALDCEQGRPVVLGVTQSLQTLFHAPAGLYVPISYSDVM